MSAGSAEKTPAKPQVLPGHHLKQLKLPTFLAEFDKLARECARDGIDYTRYLLRLAELELIERERRMVERFPAVKSLDSFDFMAIPALNKMLVLELARGKLPKSIGEEMLTTTEIVDPDTGEITTV
jgi:IstB-like ATP binding protein